MIRQMRPAELRWKFQDLGLVKTVLSQKRTRKQGRLGAMAQDRAMSALELGLGIKQRGFNIFVVGASGTGRTATVWQLLYDRARKEPTPDDIVLLYNFADRDRPLAIAVPPATGEKLKKTYDSLIERMLTSLEKTFEAETFLARRQTIEDDARKKTDDILDLIDQEARTEGFVLSRGTSQLTLTPANREGIPITEEEFDVLEDGKKQSLESSAEKLESHLEDAIRRVRAVEKDTEDAVVLLERETANQVVAPLFENAKAQWKHVKEIINHLDAMREDLLNRLRRLIPDERPESQDTDQSTSKAGRRRKAYEEEEDLDFDEPLLLRYRVNVFVTHPKNSGAPVVQETHPTASNLIGRIEQRLRAGETITDFTRVRAGALYWANGGYLVLEAQDILRDPAAWEGLKRALKNRTVDLDDPGEPGRMVSVASLRPEPVALSIKVILIGTPELYYALAKNDLDFSKLFKVKADFDVEMERNEEHITKYLHFLIGLCAEEKLRPLTPEGAGCIIEQAVRISGNQKKLTTRLGDIADLVREANYWAGKERAKEIESKYVQQALHAKAEREGFIEKAMIDDIVEGRVFIETDTEVVGQCNALTVIELGSYEFGVPLRITCRVGCGRGEIIDIERETQLGGPLHTKGTLIIRGLLADRFGQDIPLGLSATICMEQTYTDVDGDSASMAELCTLFSMLSQAPILQSFAITGSIDQRGRAQAVGGINEKIEGFFKVCQAKKSAVQNGVIFPSSNISDVMLSEAVIEAVKNETFKIYAVDTFEDALKILTGRDWDGSEGSLKPAITKTLWRLHNIRVEQKRPDSPIYEAKKRTRLSPKFSDPEIEDGASLKKP